MLQRFRMGLGLLLIPLMGWCQSDLQQINTRLKNTYIKAEEVDVLVPALKKIQVDPSQAGQEQLLFETYRMASDRYVSNNHFKQAYVLFQDYLSLKEKTLAQEKAVIIRQAMDENAKRKSMTLSAIKNTGNELASLENEIQLAEIRNSHFIRNIFLMVIVLAGIFVLLWFRISIKIKRVKDETNRYKADLLSMEKAALLGRLGLQVNNNRQKNIDVIGKEIKLVTDLLQRMEPLMVKEQLPAIKAIKDSYRAAERDLKKMNIHDQVKRKEPAL